MMWPRQFKLLLFRIFLVISLSANAENADSEGRGVAPTLQNVLPSLTRQDEMALADGKKIFRFHGETVSPGMLPHTALSTKVAREILRGGLTIGIECLFFTPLAELPEAYQLLADDERELKLYNILRSVSTLTGLEYYSASRDRMRLLFAESWAISDASFPREAIPDPLVKTIPESDFVYIHQRDRSFASHQSKMTFSASEDSFAAIIVNITPLRYMGLIRVVRIGDMQTHLLVVPVREGLLLYGAMAAKTLNIKAFRSKAKESFTHRVVALIGWYQKRLHEEFIGHRRLGLLPKP